MLRERQVKRNSLIARLALYALSAGAVTTITIILLVDTYADGA